MTDAGHIPELAEHPAPQRPAGGLGLNLPGVSNVNSPKRAASRKADAGTPTPAAPVESPPGSAPPAPNLGGRPSKYDPAYCDQVIEHCRGGRSLTSFAGQIRVARRTLSNWTDAHPEFADACEVATALACRWYEEALRKVAAGKGGPGAATAAIFGVKNFGGDDFTDKRTLEHTGRVDHRHMSYAEALEEARRRGLPVQVLLESSEE